MDALFINKNMYSMNTQGKTFPHLCSTNDKIIHPYIIYMSEAVTQYLNKWFFYTLVVTFTHFGQYSAKTVAKMYKLHLLTVLQYTRNM